MSIPADLVERVRLTVYHGFATAGAEPSRSAIAAGAGIAEADVEPALVELERLHHLVRQDGRIVLAHPFGGRSFAFSVMSEDTLWWGGCAWDAFAIPNLLHRGPMLIATPCPGCGTAHAWNVDGGRPPDGDQVAHFLVPMAHVWDDVVHACSNQRIFCSRACVSSWLDAQGLEEGSVFPLETL